MKLKKFIQKLEMLAEKHGNDMKVIMADNIPVVSPILSKKYPNKKSIIVTDKK